MKISKKTLVALSLAAAVMAGGFFTSCSEEDDDPAGAITGSNNDYTVTYTNTADDVYRCTNTTALKHKGALVKITIDNQNATSNDGVMGFIWDLRQSKSAKSWTEGTTTTTPKITEDGFQNFLVFGFKNESGTIKRYVSKYFNVTDIQAKNFGASETVSSHKEGIVKDTPCEIEIKKYSDEMTGTLSINADKTLTVWADIYPVYENSTYGVADTNKTSENYGAYVVDLYNSDPKLTTPQATKVDSILIPSTVTGYTAAPDNGTLAVYSNIHGGKSLSGTWKFADTYGADEVVEE